MAGTSAQPMIDIETLHTTVTRLADTVGRLTINLAGLMSTEDGNYVGYAGPAVRSQFFEHSRESDRTRAHELEGRIASLEVSHLLFHQNRLTAKSL